MITLDEGNQRFNYRIAGVLLENNRILLTKVEGQDFWFLPGGRCELGEQATNTLKREMREETNADILVKRLVWIIENFFSQRGKSYHELALYFLAGIPEGSPLLEAEEFHGEDGGYRLIFKWHDLDVINGLNIVPSILKKCLANIPDKPEHIVHFDSGYMPSINNII